MCKAFLSFCEISLAELRGIITDFDDPDLDSVEMSVATRHSELEGLFWKGVASQLTFHLNRVTAALMVLKVPTSLVHSLQWSRINVSADVSLRALVLHSCRSPEDESDDEYYRKLVMRRPRLEYK